MTSNPLRDFQLEVNKQDKEEHDIAAALATLIDAVLTYGQHDFRNSSAIADGMKALEQAYDRPWAELPRTLFKNGRTETPCNHVWKVTHSGATYNDCRCSLCGDTKRTTWD